MVNVPVHIYSMIQSVKAMLLLHCPELNANTLFFTSLLSYISISMILMAIIARPHYFFHSFFCTDAADLLPNRNRDVRLSAPVFLEMYDDPENNIYGSVSVELTRIGADIPSTFPRLR